MSISCKQATDYISKKEEGKLTLRQRYQLWRHLTDCYLCKIFYKQNGQITSCITEHKHNEEQVKLDAEDKSSIIAALQNAENS